VFCVNGLKLTFYVNVNAILKHIYILHVNVSVKKLHLHDFTCSCKITFKNMSSLWRGLGLECF